MKRYLKIENLPFAVLGCSLLAFLMRLWLFALGEDDRGLLASGSFPDVMSWLLVAVTIALLGFACHKLGGLNKYSQNFSASPIAALGMALAAVGFVISSVTDLSAQLDSIGLISALLGFLAALCLLLLAWARFQGQHLSILFHGVVCMFLMLYLVSHYRLWSSFPQLQSYAFELMAIVFVMLACYQRAAFDAGKGNRRIYAFCTYAAVFFCITTLPGCDNISFFLGSAVWMFCTPCRLTLYTPKEN